MKKTLAVLSSIFILLILSACGGGSDNGTTATDDIVDISAISGVTAPVLGETPVTTITETDQYTGTVSWDGGWSWSSYFGGDKAYTATITLTVKSGYTLTGVTADFFTVAGSTTVSNSADSGIITATFPATTSVSVGDSACGGIVGYVLQSGDTGYVAGEQRGLIVSATNQSTGIIWAVLANQSTSVPDGTETGLGTGSSNTDNIIAQNGDTTDYAAGLASSYTDGVYSDWFLPSWDEMYKLYVNIVAINTTATDAIAGNPYWTSSEFSASAASALNPGNGNAHNDGKSTTWQVRSVRYF